MNQIKSLEKFDTFFEKYYAPLLGFIDSYLRNREESSDIVQEAFVRLWEQNLLHKEQAVVKSYLYTTAKNMALDTLKHRKVKETFLLGELDKYKELERELAENALREFKAYSTDKGEFRKKIKFWVMKLPLSDRRIFVLSKYNNLTHQEIAEILQISPKTVEKRIKLSLLFIRKRIVILIF